MGKKKCFTPHKLELFVEIGDLVYCTECCSVYNRSLGTVSEKHGQYFVRIYWIGDARHEWVYIKDLRLYKSRTKNDLDNMKG